MRKLDFCICENKGADKLCSNCTADQRLVFPTQIVRFLFFLNQNSSFLPSSVSEQAGLCQTWSEIQKTGFLASRLNCSILAKSSYWPLVGVFK